MCKIFSFIIYDTLTGTEVLWVNWIFLNLSWEKIGPLKAKMQFLTTTTEALIYVGYDEYSINYQYFRTK